MSPDEREVDFPESEKATKGKQKKNQNGKNARTWLGEAERNLKNAIRYYILAQEWYAKDGNTDMVSHCNKMIVSLNQLQGELE